MDYLFDKCVEFLLYLCDITGFSYKEINVLIFIIIEPIVFLIMFVYIVYINRNKLFRKLQQDQHQ